MNITKSVIKSKQKEKKINKTLASMQLVSKNLNTFKIISEIKKAFSKKDLQNCATSIKLDGTMSNANYTQPLIYVNRNQKKPLEVAMSPFLSSRSTVNPFNVSSILVSSFFILGYVSRISFLYGITVSKRITATLFRFLITSSFFSFSRVITTSENKETKRISLSCLVRLSEAILLKGLLQSLFCRFSSSKKYVFFSSLTISKLIKKFLIKKKYRGGTC